MRNHEVKESRLSDEEIRRNFEEIARKNEEESKQRKEKGVKMRKEKQQQEIEELKPKARSALAARWEESVKAKTKGSRGEHRATVVTRTRMPSGEEVCLVIVVIIIVVVVVVVFSFYITT